MTVWPTFPYYMPSTTRTDRERPRGDGQHFIFCERRNIQRGPGWRNADVSRIVIDAPPGEREGQQLNIIGIDGRRCVQRKGLKKTLG